MKLTAKPKGSVWHEMEMLTVQPKFDYMPVSQEHAVTMLSQAGPRRRVSRIIMLDGIIGAVLAGAPLMALHAAAPAQRSRSMIAQPATVTVPPVKGLPADSADSVLKRAGLRSMRVPRRVITGTAGNVLDQSPAAGRSAKRGDVDTIYVTVVIRAGRASARGVSAAGANAATGTGGATTVGNVRVPRLTGLLPRVAEDTLRGRHLALKGIESRPSDASNNGRVIDQSIRPDSSVFVGTPVGVVIGSYTPPRPPPPPPPPPPQQVQTVPVPQLVKRTLAAARELVRRPGLELRITSTTQSLDPAYRDSIVLTQDPPYPRQVAPKSVVNIRIIAFSQALSDSARRDSIDRARRDSVDQAAARDSAERVSRDSARRAADSARAKNQNRGGGRGGGGGPVATGGRGTPPATRSVTVPSFAEITLRDARSLAGDSLRVIADVGAAENSIVSTQNPGPLTRVAFGTEVRVFLAPPKTFDWTWILIAAGLAALGGITLAIKRIWPPPVPPTPTPTPAPAITTRVSGDAPRVSLRSKDDDLRGPEIELHSVPAVMACDIAVDGPSLTLEDDLNAQR